MKTNKIITKYWEKHFTDEDGECILCHDIGFVWVDIDEYGDCPYRVPCICPNGQDIRANSETIIQEA
jgi:hypothetical protein